MSNDISDFINFSDECWIWTGPQANQTPRYRINERRYTSAIRMTYEYIYDQPLPSTQQFQKCSINPLCVNPEHTVREKTPRQLKAHSSQFEKLSTDEHRQLSGKGGTIAAKHMAAATKKWNEQGVLTTQQVADRYKVSLTTILYHVRQGHLQGFRENKTLIARWLFPEDRLPKTLPLRNDWGNWAERSAALVDEMWGPKQPELSKRQPVPEKRRLPRIKAGKIGGRARWKNKTPEERELYSLYMRSARKEIALSQNDIDRIIAHIQCGRTVGLRTNDDKSTRDRLRSRILHHTERADLIVGTRYNAQKHLLEFFLKEENEAE